MKTEKVETTADGSTLTTLVLTDWEDVSSLLTIHGEVASGVGSEPVTLVDAFTIGRDLNRTGFEVGPESGQQRLLARYAVLGGHLAGADENFTGVRTRLRHLDAWANLAGFDGPVAADPASITFQRPTVESARLANSALLSLDQVLSRSRDDDSAGLIRSTWLRVDHLPAMRWSELGRGVVTPLATLLTLAVGADCAAVQVEVSTSSSKRWMSLHSSGLRPPAEQPQPIHTMLLPLHTLRLAGVATWLDRAETLGPLPPVVAAIVAGPLPTVETAVLELATVAEGLARRLWPDWNRLTNQAANLARQSAVAAVEQQGKEVVDAVEGAMAHVHERSYAERLLRLAKRADSAVPGVVGRNRNDRGQPARWKSAVTDARIDLAHRLDRGWLDETTINKYLAVAFSLRWLLTGVLLLETGLPADTIADHLQQHQPYRLFLQEARQWLPRVYD